MVRDGTRCVQLEHGDMEYGMYGSDSTLLSPTGSTWSPPESRWSPGGI